MLFLLLFTSFLGILICRLIILKGLKKTNAFINSLCSTKGNFNCDAVLESPLGRLSKYIHLGDVALVYFFAQFIFLVFAFINSLEKWDYVLFIPATFAITATFILLLYQGLIIKSWCKLCLLLTTTIWTQWILCAVELYTKDSYWISDYFDELSMNTGTTPFLNGFLFLLVTSAWFFIKPQIAKASEVETIKKQIDKWKTNVLFFNAVLQQQKKVQSNYWADDLILGNPNAEIRFIVALSPFCPACSRLFKQLNILLKTHFNEVSFAVRFAIKSNDIKNNKTQAALYLYHACMHANGEQRIRILENWFRRPNLILLKTRYKNINVQETPILQKYETWLQEYGITHVPVLFINGFEFPKPYMLNDLKFLIPHLLNNNLLQKTV